MDSPFRARRGTPPLIEHSSSSSGVPIGYFTARALRAGLIDAADGARRVELLLEPASEREITERELLKERIRGEIIAREAVRMRLLEEEVRRELEIERMVATRRHRGEMLSSFGGVPAISDKRAFLARVSPGVGFEKGTVGQSVRFDGENKGTVSMPLSDARPSKAPLGGIKIKASESKVDLSGVKRKASELPGITRKNAGERAECDWSCALCQVSATSREALNVHLQGKKHKAKAVLLGAVKKAGVATSAKEAIKPLTVTKVMEPKKSQLNVEGKNLVMKTASPCPAQKQQKTVRLWCELCKVECNSSQVLACHLGGKKHRTRLEKSQSANITTGTEKKETTGDMQCSEAADKVNVKSASTGEETGIVEDSKIGKQGNEPAEGVGSRET